MNKLIKIQYLAKYPLSPQLNIRDCLNCRWTHVLRRGVDKKLDIFYSIPQYWLKYIFAPQYRMKIGTEKYIISSKKNRNLKTCHIYFFA